MELNFDKTSPTFNYSGDDFGMQPINYLVEVNDLELVPKRILKIGEMIDQTVVMHITYNATHYWYDTHTQQVHFYGPKSV